MLAGLSRRRLQKGRSPNIVQHRYCWTLVPLVPVVSVVPGPGGGGRCHCSHGHWSPHCTLTLDRSQVNISSVCLVLKKLWMFCISMASHSHSKNERKERGGYLTQCPGPGMMRHVRLVAPCAPWPLLTGTLWRWRVRTNFRPSLIPSQQPACPCPAPTIHPVHWAAPITVQLSMIVCLDYDFLSTACGV